MACEVRCQLRINYFYIVRVCRPSPTGHPSQPPTAPLRHSCGILMPCGPVTDRFTKPQAAYSIYCTECTDTSMPNSHGLLDIGTLSRGPSAWVLQVLVCRTRVVSMGGPANRCPGLSKLLVPTTQMLTPGPRMKSCVDGRADGIQMDPDPTARSPV